MKIGQALIDKEAKEQAQQAIMDYTRFQLYSALHIPAKYILDAACPTAPDAGELASRRLQRLCDELKQRGYLRLDKDGNPCVLSGENWPFAERLTKFIGREINDELLNDIRKEL